MARPKNPMARITFTPTTELAPLLEACGDHVLVRRSFAFWQSSLRVHGTIFWGRPDESDVLAMESVWDAHLATPFGPDPTLVDVRALESIDLLAFERMVRVFAERRSAWTARTGPHAILHGSGLASAATLGIMQIAAQGHRLRAFGSARDALGWLGVPALEADYDALRGTLLDAPDVVRRVRAALDEDHRLDTRELARKLGTSVRSLQRHLESAGTSLREERAQRLVARAEQLLEGTELDLAAIGAAIGAGSAGRLVALFRKLRGTTPGAFRASRRTR
ncbi:helix-turn-helix domain-containing protein [Sandaracinus amylolyticus]|uniref:helix-turn-helix domain-containing protein n=1 Tax=Sandaracinus amylolyticus TaxID=927083 RepID=UPI001F4417F5|nr:AraC family transcriptional regulator [Sandaracinus amylolyticus]UJR85572.1 Hypothetical protein I5071_76520 [Sandaracinus amylolyticus]